MVRTALVVALLVVCSLLGTATGGAPALEPSSPAQPVRGQPLAQLDNGGGADVEMLGLSAPARTEIATEGVDVSTAVSFQRNAAGAAIDRRSLEIAFHRAEDEQARRELLLQAATDVEIAIASLRATQRDRRSAYVNGTIDAGTYTQGRAVASARAGQLRRDLGLIQELSEQIPQFSMRSRIGALDATLVTFRGPVSSQVASTIRGEGDATRFYVAVSPNGSVLSTIRDGQYVREAFRSDLWTPDTTVLIGFDEVVSRVGEIYPKFNTSEASGGIGTLGPEGTDLALAGLYQVNVQYRGRTTVAYLDGDTRNVFFEVKRARLAAIDAGPSVSTSENGTRLVVNRSYDGGPLRIATVDNATRQPTDLPVLVGDLRYRTGDDGVVWALDPAGQTRVVALGEAGNASVTAVPLTPNLIDVQAAGAAS